MRRGRARNGARGVAPCMPNFSKRQVTRSRARILSREPSIETHGGGLCIAFAPLHHRASTNCECFLRWQDTPTCQSGSAPDSLVLFFPIIIHGPGYNPERAAPVHDVAGNSAESHGWSITRQGNNLKCPSFASLLDIISAGFATIGSRRPSDQRKLPPFFFGQSKKQMLRGCKETKKNDYLEN